MVAVIGDIHGCFFTLRELVRKIRVKYDGIELYSVGDLVDRGRYSCEVADFIIAEEIKFTLGNHDFMFYYYIREPDNPAGKVWKYNGYEATLDSYENRGKKMDEHLDFIIKAPFYYNLEDCFICHAGISSYFRNVLPPNYKQDLSLLNDIINKNILSDHGILWTRDELLDLGKLQVVGHTMHDKISLQKMNNVAYIDTSVYTANKLSAVIIEKSRIIDEFSVPTFIKDLYA